jgi:hypothetical protein
VPLVAVGSRQVPVTASRDDRGIPTVSFGAGSILVQGSF